MSRLCISLVIFFLCVSYSFAQSLTLPRKNFAASLMPFLSSYLPGGAASFGFVKYGSMKTVRHYLSVHYDGVNQMQYSSWAPYGVSPSFRIHDGHCFHPGLGDTRPAECWVDIVYAPKRLGSDASALYANFNLGEVELKFLITMGGNTNPAPAPKECERAVSGPGLLWQNLISLAGDGGVPGQGRADTGSVRAPFKISGSQRTLIYSSERIPVFPFIPRSPSLISHPAPIEISDLSVLDNSSNILYHGNGSAVKANLFSLNGNSAVVYGDEVLIFDQYGLQTQKLSGLTGAVKATYEYNDNFYLIKIVEPYNQVTSITRTVDGLITSVISPNGDKTILEYDNDLRVKSIIGPDGSGSTLEYRDSQLVKSILRPGGMRRNFEYDENGIVTSDKNSGGDGFTILTDRWLNNVETTYTTSEGRKTLYKSRSGSNPLNETVFPTGFVERTSFGSGGITTRSSSLFDVDSESENDPRFGSYKKVLKSTIEYIGSSTRETVFSRNVFPEILTSPFVFQSLTESKSVNGKVWSKVFDNLQKKWTKTSPEGVVFEEYLNEYEQPIKTALGNETPTMFKYDANGKIREVSIGSHRNIFEYNKRGLLAKNTDSLGQTRYFAYDSKGQMIRSSTSSGKHVGYGYDQSGNLVSVIPLARPLHSFTFNGMGLMSSYSPPPLIGDENNFTRFEYNYDREIKKQILADGSEVVYNYAPVTGLMTSIVMDGKVQSYNYNVNNFQIASSQSFDLVASTIGYFGDRGISSENQTVSSLPGAMHFSFDRDDFFRVSSRTLHGPIGQSGSINYEYNDDSQITKAGELLVEYYPLNGRLKKLVLNNVSATYGYDGNGQLSSYNVAFDSLTGSNEVFSFTLKRDSEFRIVEKTEVIRGVTRIYCYRYDAEGRISTVTADGVVSHAFAYDSNGNIVSKMKDGVETISSFDNRDRLLTHGNSSFGYNLSGEITKQERNVTDITSYEYDSLGRLKSVVLPNGSILNIGLDWKGLPAFKTLNGLVTERMIWEDGARLSRHWDPQNGSSDFIYALGINSPEYMQRNISRFFFVKDHLGSVRMIIDSDSGNIVQELTYDPWGDITSDSNPGFQPFGYSGGLNDRHSKLTRFGAREYNAEFGRWMSRDPILFSGGDTNLYGYVLNDPINRTDITGTGPVTLFLCQAIGAFYAGYGPTSALKGIYDVHNKYAKRLEELRQQQAALDCPDENIEAEIKRLQVQASKDMFKAAGDAFPDLVQLGAELAVCLAGALAPF